MTTLEIGYVIHLDELRCSHCRACLPVCNFGGLLDVPGEQTLLIDPWACTGCGSCITVCLEDALLLTQRGYA